MISACAAALLVALIKLIRIITERVSYYNAIKKFCKENSGTVKKHNGLFRSFFKIYPGYDIEMTVGEKTYGVKFFPKYLKNKNLLIESESRACLLKNTGVMGVSWRGSLPGVRTLAPDVITEVTGRRMKIDLKGASADKSVLIFSPKCKRIYYVKKAERAEAYNGDEICGYKIYYKKSGLIEELNN
jgi:hypothetical protein